MSNRPVFSNKVAENYEKLMGPLFFESYAIDMVSRIPANTNSILEIAAGTGQVTRLLKTKFPNARIVGTDLNPGMIETAKQVINANDKIEWMIADAMELPFESNAFDSVLCQFGLMFVPDKQIAVNEAFRVLNYEGKYIFNTWDKIENNFIYKIANEVTNSFFKEEPIPFWGIPFSMYEPDEFSSLMSSAGFKNIKIQKVKKEGHTASALNAASALTLGTPMYSFLAERNEKLIPEIINKVTEAISKKFGEKDLKVVNSAWVIEGEK